MRVSVHVRMIPPTPLHALGTDAACTALGAARREAVAIIARQEPYHHGGRAALLDGVFFGEDHARNHRARA